MLGMFLIIVVQVVQIQLSLGSGTLELKLVSFENPTHKVLDGTCCDSNKTSNCPPNECDPWIDICIDHITSYSQSSCHGGLSKTNVHENSDLFVFGANEGKTLNPMNFTFSSWKGGYKLNLTVQDDDHVDNGNSSYGKADMMEILLYNLTSLSGANGHPTQNRTRITLGTLVKLVIEVRAYCDKNYYGSCSTKCEPKPGKYFCDNNGNMIYANRPTHSVTVTKNPPANNSGHRSSIKSVLLLSTTSSPLHSSAKASVSGSLHFQSTTPAPSTKQSTSSYSTSRYQQTSAKPSSKTPAGMSSSAGTLSHRQSTNTSSQSFNASTISSTPSHSCSNFIVDSLEFIGVVTGIVIGSVIALLLIILLIVSCCREYLKSKKESKVVPGNRTSSSAPKSSLIDDW